MAQTFEKIKKKYALTNSYFKNRRPQDPSTPFEVLEYVIQHQELPYNSESTDNWMYECFCEYQKRAGVYNSQFFTPAKTANRIAELADEYFVKSNPYVLDACCGFGMLTKALRAKGFIVDGFDNYTGFKQLYSFFTECQFLAKDFRELGDGDFARNVYSVVSNPPYEVKECSEFIECLFNWLQFGGIAVLLLPKGFIDKERPKATVDILKKYEVLHREDMTEPFERTATKAEIVVLKKPTPF